MRYAIGEIHGGSKTFKVILDKINLKHGDCLFLLGDYVDRGPDSIGVLKMICGLIDAGYDVRPIRGNHDDMLYRTITGDHDVFSQIYFDKWGKQFFSELWGTFEIDDFHLRVLLSDKSLFPEDCFNLLKMMPYVFEDSDYVFVHGALDMSVDDPVHETSYIRMLWNGYNFVDSAKLRGRQLVGCHSIKSIDEIRGSLTSSVIRIDNGAFTNAQPERGNLVALNLDIKELIIQPWTDGETKSEIPVNLPSSKQTRIAKPATRRIY